MKKAALIVAMILCMSFLLPAFATAETEVQKAIAEAATMSWVENGKITTVPITALYDALEQTIVLGRGATRISARELLDEMRRVRTGGTDRQVARPMRRFTVEDRLDPQLVRRMRELTRGK